MEDPSLDDFVELVSQRIQEDQRREDQERDPEDNRKFVQIYEDHMTAFRQIIRENPTAAEIFYFITQNMDRTNSLACSYTVLEEVVEKGRTTVWKAVKYLKDKNFIDVSKMGNCNVYHINANVAWKSYANGKKYAKFRATVILASSEQEDISTDNVRHLKKSSNEQ